MYLFYFLPTLIFFHQYDVCFAQHCHDGWLTHNTSCYLIVRQQPETWSGAESFCRTIHGALAEINDASENNFLVNTIERFYGSKSGDYWLGGTDVSSEGEWEWAVSGVRFSFTDWDPGEPNNRLLSEHCLQLRESSQYKWNDMPCTAKFSFICEQGQFTNGGHIIG